MSFVVKQEGTLWAWGNGTVGELGDGGGTTQILSPIPISYNVAGTLTLSCGVANSVIYKSGGTLCTSGYNMYGSAGDINVNPSRNLFGCLSRNYAKESNTGTSFSHDQYEKVFPDAERENDTTSLRALLLARKPTKATVATGCTIFPNPAASTITILAEYSPSSIYITDITGKVLLKESYDLADVLYFKRILSVETLPCGAYGCTLLFPSGRSNYFPFTIIK